MMVLKQQLWDTPNKSTYLGWVIFEGKKSYLWITLLSRRSPRQSAICIRLVTHFDTPHTKKPQQ
jgi:hypothetical protein